MGMTLLKQSLNYSSGDIENSFYLWREGRFWKLALEQEANLRYYPADADIIGIDMSREMFKKARKKNPINWEDT